MRWPSAAGVNGRRLGDAAEQATTTQRLRWDATCCTVYALVRSHTQPAPKSMYLLYSVELVPLGL